MISFAIDEKKCNGCGLCAKDCPLSLLEMEGGLPAIAPEKEEACRDCLHCLAICPTGALSIRGRKPEESILLAGNLPEPDRMEALIKGRRSVRSYRDENLEPELIERLLETAWHAPTGVNARGVRFTLIDDREVMNKIREETIEALAAVVEKGALPPGREMFADFVTAWKEGGVDVLFRGAPHLVIATAPRSCPTPEADCLIALSYFELFAQSLGVGTVWDGLAKWAFDQLVPQMKSRLGIPEDHLIGYVMAFGKPAVKYHRTVQHRPVPVARVAG